ncbi:MAG TPA: hypothetical protein VD973_13845 [Symbiobacteriaceae bacterium]|nr:hypothetical protein [Symbiobacteriaceae bacterium]
MGGTAELNGTERQRKLAVRPGVFAFLEAAIYLLTFGSDIATT